MIIIVIDKTYLMFLKDFISSNHHNSPLPAPPLTLAELSDLVRVPLVHREFVQRAEGRGAVRALVGVLLLKGATQGLARLW